MMTKRLPLIFLITLTLLTPACGSGTALPATLEPATVEPLFPSLETAPPALGTKPTEQPPSAIETVSTLELTVAYIRDGNLWMWREASGPIQMTDIGGLVTVSLSEDGQWLAFQRGTEIWLARVDGTDVRQLLGNADENSKLWFTPNGSLLAVASREQIDLVELSTGKLDTVLTYPAIAGGYAPDVLWMPDSSAFKTVIPPQAEGGQAEYFFVFIDGTLASLAKFAMVSPVESAPALSPDGGYLIYVVEKDGKQSLHLMDSSGATKPYGEASDTVHAYGWLTDSKRFVYRTAAPPHILLGEVGVLPIEYPLDNYESLRWVNGEYFLGLKDGNLYLGYFMGQSILIDAGVTAFDFTQ